MDIAVFSNNQGIEKCFAEIKKSKKYNIIFLTVDEFKKTIKSMNQYTLIYLDIADFSSSERIKLLRYLAKLEDYYYGIIDPGSAIKDVSELFYNNAVDYIGPDLFTGEISVNRFGKTIKFLDAGDKLESRLLDNKNKTANNYIYSDYNWKNVKPGKEYSFCLMFVELDSQKILKEIYSKAGRDEFVNAFHDDVQDSVSRINGKIWMWLDFGGLILFPFNGKKCDAILTCFELMLNRNIISIDNYNYGKILSYRIVLHIGNTIYKTSGDTGNIVSDSINTVFNLGRQYADPGNFIITENLFEFIPSGLEDCFITVGEFDGRKIRKMIVV